MSRIISSASKEVGGQNTLKREKVIHTSSEVRPNLFVNAEQYAEENEIKDSATK